MNIVSTTGAISNAVQSPFSPARYITPVAEAATNPSILPPTSQTPLNQDGLSDRADLNSSLDNSKTSSSLAVVDEESFSESSGDVENSVGEGSEDSNPDTQPQSSFELTEQELATLQKLKSRDIEVRTHEQAHQAVGGQYASAPTYDYDRGPDGKNYAVSGEVNIQLPSQSDDPEQVIRHADQVVRAALAPAQPSAQDRRVAAQAAQSKIEAQQRLREQSQSEISSSQQDGESEDASEGADNVNSDQPDSVTRPQLARFIESANISPSNIIGEIFSITV